MREKSNRDHRAQRVRDGGSLITVPGEGQFSSATTRYTIKGGQSLQDWPNRVEPREIPLVPMTLSYGGEVF